VHPIPSVVVRTCRARMPPCRRRDRASAAGSGCLSRGIRLLTRAGGWPRSRPRRACGRSDAVPVQPREGLTAVVTTGDARQYGRVPIPARTTLYRLLAICLPCATTTGAGRRELCEPTGGLEPPTARLQVGCATSCATPAGHGTGSRDKHRETARDNRAGRSRVIARLQYVTYRSRRAGCPLRCAVATLSPTGHRPHPTRLANGDATPADDAIRHPELPNRCPSSPPPPSLRDPSGRAPPTATRCRRK
jgi:hypothetical protein